MVGTGVDRFVDATTETEVELRLPPGPDRQLPIGMVDREGGRQLYDDLAMGCSGTSHERKTATDPGRGVRRPDQL